MELRKLAVAAAFVFLCLLAGGIGAIFTTPAIPGWYASLSKPQFSPPNWVFGPVWTALYVMMGVAAYLVYERGLKNAGVRAALAVFGAQLALNAIWSFLFFGLRSPLYGLAGIIALWFAIIASMMAFWRVSRAAAALLVPYILWVSFAAALNFLIWAMN